MENTRYALGLNKFPEDSSREMRTDWARTLEEFKPQMDGMDANQEDPVLISGRDFRDIGQLGSLQVRSFFFDLRLSRSFEALSSQPFGFRCGCPVRAQIWVGEVVQFGSLSLALLGGRTPPICDGGGGAGLPILRDI